MKEHRSFLYCSHWVSAEVHSNSAWTSPFKHASLLQGQFYLLSLSAGLEQIKTKTTKNKIKQEVCPNDVSAGIEQGLQNIRKDGTVRKRQ